MRNCLIESIFFFFILYLPSINAFLAQKRILGIISRDILARGAVDAYIDALASLRQLLLVTSLFPRAYFLTRGSPGLFNPINAHTTLICAVSSFNSVRVCVCLRFSLASVALLLLLLRESLGFDVPASRE